MVALVVDVVDVVENGVDLPAVPGGIRHPDLVLAGVATGRVVLLEGDEAGLPQAAAGRLDLAGRVDPDPEVGKGRTPSLLQGQRDGRGNVFISATSIDRMFSIFTTSPSMLANTQEVR